MIAFSTASNLAIHAMAHLAACKESEPVSVGVIADALAASPSHLSKVLQGLTKHGLIRSARGAKGGFSLGRDPADVTLLEIVHASGSRVGAEECLLGRPICKPGFCKLKKIRVRVETIISDELAGITLAKFIRPPASGEKRHADIQRHPRRQTR